MKSAHFFPWEEIYNINLEYRLISKKGEGTFSEVLKAQSIKTGKYVAIKCMKAHFYDIEQVRGDQNIFLWNWNFLDFEAIFNLGD